MNMQNLMAQAQKIQKEIQKKQEEINNETFEGQSSIVTVKMNGKREVLSVSIKEDILSDKEDLQVLEDMILIAMNDALSKIAKEIETKLGMYGNGLGGLM